MTVKYRHAQGVREVVRGVGQTVRVSPVSRGRKGRQTKKPTRRTSPEAFSQVGLPDLFGEPECDCPACSGEEIDPDKLIDDLTAATTELAGADDPMNAEMMGAALVTTGMRAAEGFEEALLGDLVPRFEKRATTQALGALLAIGSIASEGPGRAVLAAADRLVKSGIEPPTWAAELSQPVTVTDCRLFSDDGGSESMLMCTFHRASRTHTVLVRVDLLDCGAATDILFVDADQLPSVLETIQSTIGEDGEELTQEELDPAEFRWQVEQALDARAVHEGDDAQRDLMDLDEDEEEYALMATLLRARLRTLPPSPKPKAPHGNSQTLRALIGADPFGRAESPAPRQRKAPAKSTRSASAKQGAIYQIKVDLRGAEPPIWRRLEVPADITLARLHLVIQVAFGWDNSHLHAFETSKGRFGIADRELGQRAGSSVTLAQVAPKARSKILYTYDFGDDWEHDIVVEKVFNPTGTINYPRCTDGSRAAPPDDCGGIWGYARLLDVLEDPSHPDHEDQLEWMGLDDPAEFDPDTFDPAAITTALSRLR
jgi:hypothetical protein